jgi:hypothetical protein
VLRLRLCVAACASLRCASLWLLCDCAALRAIVLFMFVRLAALRARVRYRRVAVWERCCACVVGGGGGGGGRWQSMLRTSVTRVLRSCMSQSQCRTAVVYEPAATATPCYKCCVCSGSGCAGRCCSRSWAGVQCRATVVRYFLGDERVECAV